MASLFPSDGHRGWGSLGASTASTSSPSGGLLLPAVVSLPKLDITILLLLALLTLLYLRLRAQPRPKLTSTITTTTTTHRRLLRTAHSFICAILNALTWQLNSLSSVVYGGSAYVHSVWLVGLEVFEAPKAWEVSSERYRQIAGGNFGLPASSVDFCSRILAKSGLGERTAFPRHQA